MKLTVCIGITCVFLAHAASAQTGIVQQIPCLAAPDGSSKEVELCYADACLAYQLAHAICQTNACRTAAALDYSLNLTACQLSMAAPVMPMGRESWITLSFVKGEWSYSFDGLVSDDAIVFQY